MTRQRMAGGEYKKAAYYIEEYKKTNAANKEDAAKNAASGVHPEGRA
ncbi:MAG: hypothetical protein LBD37_05605 [Treponema sp.]|nr:hypothetical protein [Treponema sp.]